MTEIKERLARLDAQSSALEGKATYVLTGATLLLTTAGAAQTALATHTAQYTLSVGQGSLLATHPIPWWPHAVPGHILFSFTPRDVVRYAAYGAALIYSFIAYYAWQAYAARAFTDTLPAALRDYRTYQDYEAKTLLVNLMVGRFAVNETIVAKKAWAVTWALRGLFAEIVFLTVLFLITIML